MTFKEKRSECIYCSLTITRHNFKRHTQNETHKANIIKEVDREKNGKLIDVNNKQNILRRTLFHEMNIKLFFKDKSVSYYFPKHKNQI